MNGNPNNIYFLQPEKPKISTSEIFNIIQEEYNLRVKFSDRSYLFKNINEEAFDKWYNEFRSYLNFDFTTVKIGNSYHTFSQSVRNEIEQRIICTWIYYYLTNNFKKILIRQKDFESESTRIELYKYLKSKFGGDKEIIIVLGSHILRISNDDFKKSIDHYNQMMKFI